jgi:hypothetical protein
MSVPWHTLGGHPMSHVLHAKGMRRFLVTLLLVLPLPLAIATPAFADGIFPFSGNIGGGQEVCLGPTFTEDPASARVVVLSNSSEPAASGRLQWTINRSTDSAMTNAVAVRQQSGTSVHLLVTPTDFPTLFPGWFNGCIKNTRGGGPLINVPQAYFTVMVPE